MSSIYENMVLGSDCKMPEFGIQGSKLLQWWYASLKGNKCQDSILSDDEHVLNLPQNWDQLTVCPIQTLTRGGWLNTCFEESVVWKGITHSFSVQGLLMLMGTAISATPFQTKAFFLIAEAIWSAWCFLHIRECSPLIHSCSTFPYSLYNTKGQNKKV